MRIRVVLGLLGIVQLACVADAQTLTPKEARSALGRPAVVRGAVTQLGQVPPGRGPLVLELDGEPRNSVFRVVIPAGVLPVFGKNARQLFRDQEISVSGRVLLIENVPQIIVTSREQVRIETGKSSAVSLSSSEPESPATGAAAAESKPASAKPEGGPASMETASLPPNLLKNGDFSQKGGDWKLPPDASVGSDACLHIKLDPKHMVRVEQTFAGIPKGAIQFQAFFRAQLAKGSELSKPLMLRMGPTADEGSYLPRPVHAAPGEWTTIKWTRTSDLKGYSKMTFYIDAGPGTGELIIDDAYLFAHPDWKDKKTWKVSDG